MTGRIMKLTNQKMPTDVAVVRVKRFGKCFEIACHKNKLPLWRNKTEKDINKVLYTYAVFTDVSTGERAKRKDLMAVFRTDDLQKICETILDKGGLKLSEKERQAASRVKNMTEKFRI